MSTYLCVVAVDVEADDEDESLIEIASRACDEISILMSSKPVLHMAEHSHVARARLMAALEDSLTVSLS